MKISKCDNSNNDRTKTNGNYRGELHLSETKIDNRAYTIQSYDQGKIGKEGKHQKQCHFCYFCNLTLLNLPTNQLVYLIKQSDTRVTKVHSSVTFG